MLSALFVRAARVGATLLAGSIVAGGAAAAPVGLDLTAGGAGHLVRDEASSPLLYGGGGGVFDARLTVGATRHELALRAEVAGLSGGHPQASATSLAGEVGYRLLPRLGNVGPVELRAGPGLGVRAWTLDAASVLNDHRTWAFGTELSLAAVLEAPLGPADRLELAGALPLAALAARPPYATTDEALRTRGDDPFALAFTGTLGSLDGWARPSASLRWVRDTGRVRTVGALDASWLRAAAPAPLRGWFVGVRAGVRVGGAR